MFARPGRALLAGLVGGALLGGFVAGGTASAAWDTYGALTAAGGYTDNALSVPQPRPGDPDPLTPEADSFAEVTPEFFVVSQGRRSRIDASYQFSTQVYQSHEEANSYTNRGQLSWLSLLSPQTDLKFELQILQGERSAFQQGGPLIGQAPAARLRTVEISLGQSIEHQFLVPWTLREALTGSTVRPFGEGADEQPDNKLAELRLELFREYPNMRWGGEFTSLYTVTGETTSGGVVVVPSQVFLINRALVAHQRALTRQIEVNVAIGAMQVADGEDPSVAIYEPSGRLGASYTTSSEETVIGAHYDHGAGASTYTGDVSLMDTIGLTLRKELLPDQEMVFTADASYAFARNFSIARRAVGDRADIIQANARLGWQVEESLVLGLLVTAQRQTPRDDPMVMSSVQDLRRNAVLLTMTATVGATGRRRPQQPGGDRTGERRRDILDGARSEGGDGRR